MTLLPRKRRDADYLQDIIEYANKAIEFCRGVSLSEFENDTKILFAVSYCLQVIGEASSQLTEETRNQFIDIPWREMRAMRNILVHAYHNADSEIIFLTIKNRLPDLIVKIRAIQEDPI